MKKDFDFQKHAVEYLAKQKEKSELMQKDPGTAAIEIVVALIVELHDWYIDILNSSLSTGGGSYQS